MLAPDRLLQSAGGRRFLGKSVVTQDDEFVAGTIARRTQTASAMSAVGRLVRHVTARGTQKLRFLKNRFQVGLRNASWKAAWCGAFVLRSKLRILVGMFSSVSLCIDEIEASYTKGKALICRNMMSNVVVLRTCKCLIHKELND